MYYLDPYWEYINTTGDGFWDYLTAEGKFVKGVQYHGKFIEASYR